MPRAHETAALPAKLTAKTATAAHTACPAMSEALSMPMGATAMAAKPAATPCVAYIPV